MWAAVIPFWPVWWWRLSKVYRLTWRCAGAWRRGLPIHCQRVGDNLNKPIFDYASRIFHIHFKDCHVDKQVLHDQSIYGHGWWTYETPGDGDIDWESFFDSLRQIGYSGDWTFDLKGSTRLVELPRGIAFIQPILNRVFERV